MVKLSIEQTKTKVKRKDEFNNEQHNGRVFHSARDMQIKFKCPFSFSSKKYNNRPKDKNMNICTECRIISKIELFTESSIFISWFKTHSPTNKHTSQSQSSSKTFCSNVRNPFNGEKYFVSLQKQSRVWGVNMVANYTMSFQRSSLPGDNDLEWDIRRVHLCVSDTDLTTLSNRMDEPRRKTSN